MLGSREGLTSGSLQDVEAFYHFMMRCPADRSRAELYHTRMWITISASGNKPAQDPPKAGAKGQPGNLFEVLLQSALESDNRLLDPVKYKMCRTRGLRCSTAHLEATKQLSLEEARKEWLIDRLVSYELLAHEKEQAKLQQAKEEAANKLSRLAI
eukprot:g20557.t1